MIISATFVQPSPSLLVAITMTNGSVWYTEADLPPDTDLRRMLHEWLAQGNTIDPYVAPNIVPQSVTAAQARIALYEVGLLDQVDTIARNHPYRPVQLWYEYAQDWNIDNPYIRGIALELGVDDETIKSLFIRANELT